MQSAREALAAKQQSITDMNTDQQIRDIHDYESALDAAACELLLHAAPETEKLYHSFSRALQSDLRTKFGDVFDNFPSP